MKQMQKVWPGMILTALIAWLALQIQTVPMVKAFHLSSLIIAIVLGMVLGNLVQIPGVFGAGVRFSAKKILRLAIILLGFSPLVSCASKPLNS